MKHLKFNVANEIIEYQSEDFFDGLTEIFGKLKRNEIKEKECSELVVKLTKKYTNMSINLNFNNEFNAFSESDSEFLAGVFYSRIEKAIPIGNPKIMLGYVIEKFVDDRIKVKEEIKKIQGNIDFKTGKVYGYFSEAVSTIAIGRPVIEKTTPEEIAAIFLHELGHSFTSMSYMNRVYTFNLVMGTINRELNGSIEYGKLKYVIEHTEHLLNIKPDKSLVEECKDKDGVEVFNIYYAGMFRKWMDTYDMEIARFFYQDASEELAELYVSRWGTKASVALAKIRIGAFNDSKLTGFSFVNTIITLAALSIFVKLPITTFLVSSYTYLPLNYALNTRPEQAVSRMRNQLVNRLKSARLTKEVKQSILDSIKEIDGLKDDYKSIGIIYKILSEITMYKTIRRTHKRRKFHTEIENMTNNNLFIQSAKLSVV